MTSNPYQDEIKQYLLEQFSLPGEQIESMLPELIATLADHIATLESRLEDGDLLQLGKAGHTMKGALLNLGLLDCADLAHKIELDGKAGRRDIDYDSQVALLRQKLTGRVGGPVPHPR